MIGSCGRVSVAGRTTAAAAVSSRNRATVGSPARNSVSPVSTSRAVPKPPSRSICSGLSVGIAPLSSGKLRNGTPLRLGQAVVLSPGDGPDAPVTA